MPSRPIRKRSLRRRASGALFAALCVAPWGITAVKAQQALPLRGSQTGLEDPAQTPPASAQPDLIAPLTDEERGSVPPKRPAPALKRPPALPPLSTYPTYPPAGTEARARRKVTGPAKPLATTGLPPLPGAAGTPKRITKYDPNPAPPPAAAAIPAPATVKTPPSTIGPYDPIGFDIGGLRLTPFVEGDIGYESNPSQATTAAGSGVARTEAGAKFKSDWSRHAVSGELKAGYTDYFTARSSSHPDLSFTATGKIDVTHDTDINLESHFNYTTQRNLQTVSGVTSNVTSGIYDSGVAAGITQRFGRLTTSLRGSLDRTAYANPTIAGSTLNLSSGNFTALEVRARAGYELTPGFTPYIQASVDTRQRDSKLDTNGFARSSNGTSLRLGTTYELSRILTADANVGVGTRDYADARLKTNVGPVADLSLIWQATPLSTVTLKGSSAQDETSLTGASGIWDTKASLQIDHALLRNLNLTGNVAYQNNKYTGTSRADHITTGSLAATYALTRDVLLRGSYNYTHQSSSDPGSRYSDNVFLFGIKLQH